MTKSYVLAGLLFMTPVCQAAAIVSNGTGGGPWSKPGTWAMGVVPSDADAVTILAGDIVTFDVDMSGWATGIAGLTCNGTMTCSTVGGRYHLKTSADIGGTGKINCGSSETAYPPTCTMAFDFDSKPNSFECGAGLTLNLHCTQPVYAVVALSDAAVAGQTELTVNTDLSGDIWTPGTAVRVDGVSGNLPDSERRVIRTAGVPVGTIVVDSGLTAPKAPGSTIVLVTRNIRIIGSTDAGVKFINGGVLDCEISNCSRGVGVSFSCTIPAVISNCSYGSMYASGGTFSGTITGCNMGLAHPSGCLVSGTISGCNQGVYYGSGCMIAGTISGCNVGIYAGSNSMENAVLHGNKYDMWAVVCGFAHNSTLGSAIENYDYDTGAVPPWNYVASYDHDGVADAFTAWTRGGTIVADLDIAPPGYAMSYRHKCTSSAMPCFRQEMITVGANRTLDVSAKILILNNHDLWAPRLEIIDVYADPLVDAGVVPLAAAEIPEPRGRYYWQDVNVRYTNTTMTAKQVWIRCSARQSGVDVYEVWDAYLQ